MKIIPGTTRRSTSIGRLFRYLLILISFCYCLDMSAREIPVVSTPSGYARADHLKLRVVAGASIESVRERLATQYGISIIDTILPYRQSMRATWEQMNGHMLPAGNIARLLDSEEPLLRSFTAYYTGTLHPMKLASVLMSECGDIEIAEPWYVGESAYTPNDSMLSEQRLLSTIEAFAAWDLEKGDTTIAIGISDTGVFVEHEDLKDNLFINQGEIPDNGIDDDENGYVDDYLGYNLAFKDDGTSPGNPTNPTSGHGTSVAGIAGATFDNALGYAGVGAQCRVRAIKTTPNGSRFIVYGYESILYCTITGVPIVNCSWGSSAYSCIDESIVRYAIARGTIIVAAAGNHGSTIRFYPAAYQGVISVGVTNPNDELVPMTARGHYLDVVAPGQESRTTDNTGGYGGFCCTSGSAPIVSGLVGLMLSANQTLTARQVQAILRVTVDGMKGIPAGLTKELLPGRINAHKAVQLAKWPRAILYVDSSSVKHRMKSIRPLAGDTVVVTTSVNSIFGGIKNLRRKISIIADSMECLELNSAAENQIGDISEGSTRNLPPILLHIKKFGTYTVFVKQEFEGTDSMGLAFATSVLVPVIPTPGWITLRNNAFTISVTDNGRFGNIDREGGEGEGFLYMNHCGMIYEAAHMISCEKKVVNAVRAEKGYDDHFFPEVRIGGDGRLTGSYTDALAPDSIKLGLRVFHQLTVPTGDSSVAVHDITIENISGRILNNVASAWFMDWDLPPQPLRNKARQMALTKTSAVITITGETLTPAIACGILSWHSNTSMICRAIDNAATYDGFRQGLKDTVIRLGVSESFSSEADIAIVAGVLFNEPMMPYERRTYRLITAIAQELPDALDLVQAYTNELRYVEMDMNLVVYPNPALGFLQVEIGMADSRKGIIEVCDMTGRIMTSVTVTGTGTRSITPLIISELSAGSYFVRLRSEGMTMSRPLLIVR